MIALLLLLATADPTVTTRTCDRIEVNTYWQPRQHFAGGAPKWEPTLSQVIYWQWHGSGYRVVAWRILKDDPPVRDSRGAVDRQLVGGRIVETRAPILIETNTTYDPEVADRADWPEELRPDWWKKR